MAMPLGLTDSGAAFAGLDQTAFRVLATDYPNASGRRRLVQVAVDCTSTVTAQAIAGYISTVGGQTLTAAGIVGISAGANAEGRFQFGFVCDPGGTYRVTSVVGSGATVSLIQWVEVDF